MECPAPASVTLGSQEHGRHDSNFLSVPFKRQRSVRTLHFGVHPFAVQNSLCQRVFAKYTYLVAGRGRGRAETDC